MKDFNIEKYSRILGDPQIAYEKSLSEITIESYEETDFQLRLSEITNLMSQILNYEVDFRIKDVLHKLEENISDTREIIKGHKEAVTGSVYPHLLSFLGM